VDWWIGGLVDWWIGGLVDWWIGGLVDWWIGGLVAPGSKKKTARLFQNQTQVLLLPFIRGEGRDEGFVFGIRGSWEGVARWRSTFFAVNLAANETCALRSLKRQYKKP
jgi:hypothetical protein